MGQRGSDRDYVDIANGKVLLATLIGTLHAAIRTSSDAVLSVVLAPSCAACGAELRAGARFCGLCGAAQPAAPEVPAEDPAETASKPSPVAAAPATATVIYIPTEADR